MFVFTKPHQEQLPQEDPLAVKKYSFTSRNQMTIAGLVHHPLLLTTEEIDMSIPILQMRTHLVQGDIIG